MEEISNEKLLQGARNLKAKGYSPEQVNSWLMTHNSSLDAMKSFVASQKKQSVSPLQLTNEQKAKIQDTNNYYNRKFWNNLTQAIDDFNTGAIEGLISGAETAANGYSLGYYDELIPSAKKRRQALQERADAAGVGALNRALNTMTKDAAMAQVLVGSGKVLNSLGLLGKGQGITSKVARAVLAPSKDFVTASAGGGFVEGLLNPESVWGKIAANLLGGSAASGLHGLSKRTYLNLMSGLENIANDTDALKIVRRAAKYDEGVAKKVLNDVSEVANDINQKSANEISRYLGPKINVEEKEKAAKDIYGKYVNENMNASTGYVKSPRDFNEWQQNVYDEVIEKGLPRAPKGSKPYKLGHMNAAKKLIADKIKDSLKTIGLKVENSDDTALLQPIKRAIDKMLEPSGIKPFDAIVEQAKRMKDLYNIGREYKPSNIKYSNIDFGDYIPGDMLSFNRYLNRKKAFKTGLQENILYNSKPQQNLSKEIKNYQNILKELSTADNYKDFMNKITKNETAFARLIGLTGAAERKMTIPEASRVFLREQYESAKTAQGAIADAILGRIYSSHYRKAANSLLDNKGKSVEVLKSPVVIQALGGMLKGIPYGAGASARNKAIEALSRMLLEDENN